MQLYTDVDIGHQSEKNKAVTSSRLRALQHARPGRAPGCFLKTDQPTATEVLTRMGVHDPPAQCARYKFPVRCSLTQGPRGPAKQNARPIQTGPDCSHAESQHRHVTTRGTDLRGTKRCISTRHPTHVDISFGASLCTGKPDAEALTKVKNANGWNLVADPTFSLHASHLSGTSSGKRTDANHVRRHPCSRGSNSRPSNREADFRQEEDYDAASPLLVQGSRPGSAMASVVDSLTVPNDRVHGRPFSAHHFQEVKKHHLSVRRRRWMSSSLHIHQHASDAFND